MCVIFLVMPYLLGQSQFLLGPLYLGLFLILQLSKTIRRLTAKSIMANVFFIAGTKIQRYKQGVSTFVPQSV